MAKRSEAAVHPLHFGQPIGRCPLPESTHNQKVCIKCGLDCSDRPRVKDAQGNYACKSCVEDRLARPPAPHTPPAPPPQPGDAYRIEPEASPSRGEAQRSRESAAPHSCPICLRHFIDGTDACVHCGFNPTVGLQAHTGIGRKRLGRKGLTCGKCGYDLAGLPSLRCPECGTVAKFKSPRELDREVAASVTRWAYLTPLLMFAIAGSILFIILSLIDSPTAAVSHFAGYLLEIPIGILVLFACCLLWIGFDAPLHLIALRLAGIYAVVDVVFIVILFLPVPGLVMLLLWIIPLLLYVSLLAALLDLEFQDAFIVAFATAVVKVLIVSVLMMG